MHTPEISCLRETSVNIKKCEKQLCSDKVPDFSTVLKCENRSGTSRNGTQAPVVERLYNAAIDWIDRYSMVNVIKTNHTNWWILINPVESVIHLSNNQGQAYSRGHSSC